MDKNLVLYAASYSDPDSAEADYKAIKDAQAAADIVIVGSVVLKSDSDGKIDVNEGGSPVLEDTFLGGLAGVAVGLFAPPLLLAIPIGAGIGAGIGELVKRHQQKELGVEVAEFLPPDSSAIVVVAEDLYADRIDKAMAKAQKKVTRAIEAQDWDTLTKELGKAGYDVTS
jgi:uncharacterized membrane protein